MTDGSHHRSLPSSEAVKLEAVARLLRQALRLAEGAEASAQARTEGEGVHAAPSSPPPTSPAPTPTASSPSAAASATAPEPEAARPGASEPSRPGPAGGGPAQVGYLLSLLQTEQARIDESKKEVARKDTELLLKIQFAKKKEEDLESRESELKKLEAQLRVREMQITRREERMRDMGRMGSSDNKEG